MVLPAATTAVGWDVPAAITPEPTADHSHDVPAKDDACTAGWETDTAATTANNDPKQLRSSTTDAANDLNARSAATASLSSPNSYADSNSNAINDSNNTIIFVDAINCSPEERGGTFC